MKYLTMKEWLVKSFTPDREEWFTKQIKERIEQEPDNSWLKGQTSWSYYVHYFGIGVSLVNGVLVESRYQTYEDVVFLETVKDFYPCYLVDDVKYCKATLHKHESNLDLWTIHLSGDDDYSVSLDILGEEAARDEWDRLFNQENGITDECVKDYYFSN